AMRSNQLQTEMLRQQSEEIVRETVVDALASVKDDPVAQKEMGEVVKQELKQTIKTLTAQTTSRLVEVTDVTREVSSHQIPERASSMTSTNVTGSSVESETSLSLPSNVTAQPAPRRMNQTTVNGSITHPLEKSGKTPWSSTAEKPAARDISQTN